MAGDQRPLELRQNRPAEAVHAGPGVLACGDHGEQVVADLVTQVLAGVPGRAKLAERGDGWGFTHSFTVTAARESKQAAQLPGSFRE